jgi:preprotein translocase subunit YajC
MNIKVIGLSALSGFGFISSAHAQAAPGGFGGFDFMSMLPLVLIFAVFYFFLIRPQQKKVQQQKQLLSTLRRGDRVMTTGGIIGVISKVVSEQELQVEIAEGVRVRVARAMVAELLSKTEPVSESSEESPSSEHKKADSKHPVKKAAGRPKKQ